MRVRGAQKNAVALLIPHHIPKQTNTKQNVKKKKKREKKKRGMLMLQPPTHLQIKSNTLVHTHTHTHQYLTTLLPPITAQTAAPDPPTTTSPHKTPDSPDSPAP